MSSDESDDTFTTLLSSLSSSLVYTVPLLIPSAILTFAGAFLTLDRTRTFRKATVPPLNTPNAYDRFFAWFALDGGVGGILIGYVCGGMILHLSRSY